LAIVDVGLKGESGFDLAWQLAAISEGRTTNTVMTSTRSEADFAELVAVTPTLGFIPKNQLSADAIRDFACDHSHGHGCRHEALVYSSPDELVAGALPFMRHALARGEHVLVVLKDASLAAIRQALGTDASKVEFADAGAWYQSPEHAFQSYGRYVDDVLESGAPRVRIVAEVVWPDPSARVDVAGWKRYEARISGAMAFVPVSFICAYDSQALPAEIIMAAQRTHPILRGADGARPSSHYSPPGAFIRDLERDVPESIPGR
jgi:hypothetical protein